MESHESLNAHRLENKNEERESWPKALKRYILAVDMMIVNTDEIYNYAEELSSDK